MAYKDVVLADRPVGYWRMGERYTVARDYVAGRDAAYSGSPTATTGERGLLVGDSSHSALFGNTTGYAQVASNAAFTLTSVAVEAWIQRTAAVSTLGVIATHQNQSYQIAVNSSNVLQFTNVNVAHYATGISIATGVIYHIVAVVIGTALTVWVDGVLRYSTTISALVANANVIDIGNDHFGLATFYFPGRIQDLAVYASLKQDRIIAHYRAGIGQSPARLRRAVA